MDAVILRTTVALAAVLLVMWFCARLLRRSAVGRGTDVVELVGRQQLSKTASVAVVRVADRAYIVGVTDARVELLAETSLEAVRPAATAAREQRTPVAAVPVVGPTNTAPIVLTAVRDIVPEHPTGGVLAGSALSPATWKSGFHELRERSVRRP